METRRIAIPFACASGFYGNAQLIFSDGPLIGHNQEFRANHHLQGEAMNRPDSSLTPQPAGVDGRPPGALSERVQSLRLQDRNGGSTTRLPWVLCVILLGTTLAFGVQSFRKSLAPESAENRTGSPDPQAGETDIVLRQKGYIIPAHPILVTPLVGGKVEALYIEEGMRVQEGQILAQIEVIEYESKYKHALAKYESARLTWELSRKSYPEELARARHDLDEAKADLSRARDVLDRAERLDLTTQSREELIRMRKEAEMADARVKRKTKDVELADLGQWRVSANKAEMEAAQAEMIEARWRLDNCTIIAPVSGTILSKDAEENNLLNPVAFKVAAQLCGMADLSDLEVDLTIQERDIDRIVIGQECLVMPEAFQKNKKFLKKHPDGYIGKVSRLMPTADRAKGAIPVRVKVSVPRDEEGVYLKPDMGVIVSFKKVSE
jgi:multidrug resistance efflux pump